MLPAKARMMSITGGGSRGSGGGGVSCSTQKDTYHWRRKKKKKICMTSMRISGNTQHSTELCDSAGDHRVIQGIEEDGKLRGFGAGRSVGPLSQYPE